MKIGQFELIRITETGRHEKGLFKCFCGNEFECQTYAAKSGVKKSCGCIKHGFTKMIDGKKYRREYTSYRAMIRRCYNVKSDQYKNYGGRGIKVCDRWRNSFNNFINDMGLAPSKEHTLDRKKVNGDYKPSNCKWSTQKEQARNKRNNIIIMYNDNARCLSEWSEVLGINVHTLSNRLKRGWTVSECFTTKPVIGRNQWQ